MSNITPHYIKSVLLSNINGAAEAVFKHLPKPAGAARAATAVGKAYARDCNCNT